MSYAAKLSVICTLFEGHYHYGVAALTNSLYNRGYRGDIYAGYRGELPPWTAKAKPNETLLGTGGKTLKVASELDLHFIPLDTDYHLTNYKPNFLLRVWTGPAKDALKIFYFDPDIVVTAPWDFFEEWSQYGLTLCEDVNSPLSQNHPRRVAWRRFYEKSGIRLSFKNVIYANAGYIGLSIRHSDFLSLWNRIQEGMSTEIGGLNRSALSAPKLLPKGISSFSPFAKTDQDALNATIEAWDGEISFVGKEGMSLINGAALMPHALGQPKPWKWNSLYQALIGRPPRLVDREYWKNARGIILAHSAREVRQRLLTLKIAALVGRFYKRS